MIKVLLISHTCQSRTEGQPKARCLHRIPGLDLRVLVPDRWKHYGQWRPADVAPPEDFRLEVGKVACPWVGPAQFYLHWYPSLRRTLEEFRPDVIDLWEEPWSAVSAHACWLRQRVLPAAKIVSETEQNIDKRLPFPFERFRAYTLGRADYAVARNTEAVDVLRSKGYAGPAEVVPNAVDAELFRPLDRAECRRELGLTGFVAGYVGRLVEEKGLADLVDALAFCPDDVTLLFVGGGPLQPELERRARDLGKSDRLRFLGPRPLTELPRVMNAIDVLTLPSRTTARWKEQFGRVLIEANACGTPVIGSDSGAIPDVVGGAGLVAREQDPRALADALRRLRDDAGLRARMGAAGRAQVEQRYTWQRVAERMHAIYQKVLGQPADDRHEARHARSPDATAAAARVAQLF
jgi:glycosyltransferase involved in cell wall biosynthesis